MCGIGGILRVWPHEQRAAALRTPHDQSIPEGWLDIIDDSIRHRGPDGHGRFRDRAIRADGCVVDVALVHRRLSIIDHAGGAQPMVLRVPKGALSASSGSSGSSLGGSAGRPTPGRLLSPEEVAAHTRRIVAESHLGVAANPELALAAPLSGGHDHIAVVFNGCIYNHRELRAELQRAGHVFSTDHSDTEVLVHGWREWGNGLSDRLDGMYALAIWNSCTGMLHFTRDRAGEKPLFECVTAKTATVIFGSTAATVLRTALATGVNKATTIEQDSRWVLSEWIRTGWYERPPTTYVHEVQPGDRRNSEIRGSGIAVTVEPGKPLPDRHEGGALGVERADDLVEAAVRSRLESDVPIACFLSGGVDSSLVAVHAKRALGHLATFTIRMPDHRHDESEWAERVASMIGTHHLSLDCRPSPSAELIALVAQLGVPFGDSSLLPTHWVSRAAKEHASVAIGGDGGDELFGGYDRYRAAKLLDRWHRIFARMPIPMGATSPRSRRERAARLVRAARGSGYSDLLAIFDSFDFERLTGVRASTAFHPDPDPLRTDFHRYLPFDLMRKSDTASMAVALEVRAPLLQRSLVDACFVSPLTSLMPHGQRKGLLRQVARKYLPAEIVDRPKMGFAIPIGEWFRTDYGGLRTMLLDHLNSTEPFGPPSLGIDLNMNFVRQMLDEHLGTGPSGLVKRDHSQRLYMLLVLSIWAKWLGGLAGSSPRT